MNWAPKRSHLYKMLLIVAVVGAGTWLRLTVVLESRVDNQIRGDARSYFFYAVNLRESGTYSRDVPELLSAKRPVADAVVAPGYPIFLALHLPDKGASLSPVGFAASMRSVQRSQALLSVATLVIVFVIGARVAGFAVGILATALTAISPHMVNINIYLVTEPLFTCLALLMSWLLLRTIENAQEARPAAFLLAGLLAGLAALTRPSVQYLPFLITAYGIIAMPQRRRLWVLFFGMFVVLMTTWSLRNVAVTGSFSDPTLMRATIQHGGYPNFMYNDTPKSLGVPYLFDPHLSAESSLQDILSVLWQRVSEQPGEYLYWYLIGKPYALFHWDSVPVGTRDTRLLVNGDIFLYPTPVTPYSNNPSLIAAYALAKMIHLPLITLAGLACIFAWLPSAARFWRTSRRQVQVLSLVLIYVLIIHMVGAPFPRYAIPFFPIVYILAIAFAAHTLVWLAHRQR